MKIKFFSVIILLFTSNIVNSQTFGDPTNFRPNPTTKQEKLNEVQKLNDLSPRLWPSMVLPHNERSMLEENRKSSYALGYYAYPKGGYEDIVEFVKVIFSAKIKGIVQTAESNGEQLTEKQKQLILNADTGTDIGINVQFRHKDPYKKNISTGDIVTGWTTITIVPATEAEFPGGYTEAATYVSNHVIKKMKGKDPQATITFTVNEKGKAIAAKLTGMFADPKAEKLLQEAIEKMPLWKPAKNSKGENIKQEINFQFGGGGC